jgi:hypothetical protein
LHQGKKLTVASGRGAAQPLSAAGGFFGRRVFSRSQAGFENSPGAASPVFSTPAKTKTFMPGRCRRNFVDILTVLFRVLGGQSASSD